MHDLTQDKYKIQELQELTMYIKSYQENKTEFWINFISLSISFEFHSFSGEPTTQCICESCVNVNPMRM